MADRSSIEKQIRLATWLLLFAEFATENRDLSLWSGEVDSFQEGAGLLAEIQRAIDKDPAIEKRISAVPVLAMRLDAARVRKDQTEKRQQLARGEMNVAAAPRPCGRVP